MRLLLCLLIAPATLLANIRVPHSRLVGESVEVALFPDCALVEGVYAFDLEGTTDLKEIFLPVFDRGDSLDSLLRSEIEVTVRDKPAAAIVPCGAPTPLLEEAAGQRLQWFQIVLAEPCLAGKFETTIPLTIRLRYTQRLINGRFYYLPVIPNQAIRSPQERDWHFQMHVTAPDRTPRVVSPEVDFETVGKSLVIFLKDGVVVQIE